MTFDHFDRMERKLLASTGINQRVVNLLMAMLRAERERIEKIRTGEYGIPGDGVRAVLLTPLDMLQKRHAREIPSERIAAAILLVSDLGVLFTTRDWGVTGTLSAMASACAALAK
jgi:hypothetical protein